MENDLNSYGTYIGTIIIMLVFLVGLIIIIDELYNISKFCYRYTYLYNYGKVNENTCKENKIEYETTRFRIYNEIDKYKFNKDLFSKSWLNYAYFITILILTILLCLAFGYLFRDLFIKNNATCEVNNPNSDSDTVGWSVLKIIMRCFCGSCHKIIPNCFVNYLMLGIIILVYPAIYILKVFFKTDYTTDNKDYLVKIFHLIFFISVVFYVYYIYMEDDETQKTKEKYIKMLVYLFFIAIFYANNYFFNTKFNEYSSLTLLGNSNNNSNENDIDTTFFDMYKQEEPIKPQTIDKPPMLATFKYCTSNELYKGSDTYCSNMSNLNVNLNLNYQNSNNAYFNCVYNNPNNKVEIDKYLRERNFYAIDKFIIDDYYKKLKKYDDDMQIYNYKYNIYKTYNNEFPEIVYLLFHMVPKMTGINKKENQLLLILIVLVIILTYYLKMNNNENMDYVYYTIYLYLLGLISISLLVNGVLTYNTFVNKYLIYEPLHNYKNSLYNKNIILNMIINKDTSQQYLYKLNTDKFNDKISGLTLTPVLSYKLQTSPSDTTGTEISLDNFINKVKKDPSIINADFYNLNSPVPPSTDNLNQNDYKVVLNIQLNFYKTIYSSLLIKNDGIYDSKFLITRLSENRGAENYVKFNYYKITSVDTNNYLSLNSGTLETSGNISDELKFMLKLIENNFISSEADIPKRINQLKLNLDYYIFNNNKAEFNYENEKSITFASFIDTYITYTYNQINYKDVITSKNDVLINIVSNYKLNKILIDNAFNIYGEFLKDFRKNVISLFNSCGVACDYTDFIDIKTNMDKFKKALFTNPSNVNYAYKFKLTTNEPNIDLYKQIIILNSGKINDSMNKHFNLMKIYIKSLKTSNYITASGGFGGTSSGTVDASKSYTQEIIKEIIKNYNLYNLDSKRHIGNDFIIKGLNINPNYSKSKYDKFNTLDIKKMKISIDNVSSSFIILIIIFAIILIEPTVI